MIQLRMIFTNRNSALPFVFAHMCCIQSVTFQMENSMEQIIKRIKEKEEILRKLKMVKLHRAKVQEHSLIHFILKNREITLFISHASITPLNLRIWLKNGWECASKLYKIWNRNWKISHLIQQILAFQKFLNIWT